MTVITRNLSNKHSPVQSGSSSDWPQPNGSIDWSSAVWRTRTDWRKVANAVVSFQHLSAALAMDYWKMLFSSPGALCCEKDEREERMITDGSPVNIEQLIDQSLQHGISYINKVLTVFSVNHTNINNYTCTSHTIPLII